MTRPPAHALWRLPLIRLLAINLAAGFAVALLMLGGLLLINPGHLRELIFSDRTGPVALGLLLFGLVVTFGSVAMGSAVMMLGREPKKRGGGGKRAAVRVHAEARR
ncbi:MAG: hypothetical protein P8Y71_10300 [Pseudolabrys sp.]